MSILNLTKLSKIYYQKFLNKLVDDFKDVKHYIESTPQETKKLLKLFQLRNESHKQVKGSDNPHFTKIIALLHSCKESKLVMHIIKIKDQLRIILTDINCSQVVGEL